MKVVEHLIHAVRDAAVFNPEIHVAPACILWPDHDRQFEAVIPRLQGELPELLVLGDYDPDKRTGPAIWLRCVLAQAVDDIPLPHDLSPIFYLPGVSRQDLRAVENCPEPLKPLAELQYRGVIWSQLNAKDWTVLAFLKSEQGGLGLDVAQDAKARNAMQLALYRLLDEDVALLKDKRLDRDYFNTLLTGGDPVRELLQWLDQGDTFKEHRSENEWKAFIEVCKSQMAFNPQNDGLLEGAAKLAVHEGPWQGVWTRFCEAPTRYPQIPERIRKCRPPNDTMFWNMGTGKFHGWPQWNADQEALLRSELSAMKDLPPHEARNRLAELDKRHQERRLLVWAELGESPLAYALEHLKVLAETTSASLAAGSAREMAAAYASSGWRGDDALVKALACVEKIEDLEAVTSAVRSVYMAWAEEAALYLQKEVDKEGYPGGTILTDKGTSYRDGECVVFVDGLRFDAGRRLEELLSAEGYEIEERIGWAPLPTLTATGKPFAAPVRDQIRGEDANVDFEPSASESGKSLKGGYHLDKLLRQSGWKELQGMSWGDGQGNAWCESGNIDHEGHDRGWKLAGRLETLLGEIRDRVAGLLSAGWQTVRIVTDHGWLLLPGGLPKMDIPAPLVENKWGRCASLKPGACADVRVFPWYWNPHQYVALADGIRCFRKGLEFSHGGLSLQESLILELKVSNGSTRPARAVEITDVVWRGLRCSIGVDGEYGGVSLDIRTKAGNPTSSVVLSPKPFKENGTASVVVEDEQLEGTPAFIVLLDDAGEVAAQVHTIIGGGDE